MMPQHAIECPTCGAVPGRLCKDMGEDAVHFTRALAYDDLPELPPGVNEQIAQEVIDDSKQ